MNSWIQYWRALSCRTTSEFVQFYNWGGAGGGDHLACKKYSGAALPSPVQLNCFIKKGRRGIQENHSISSECGYTNIHLSLKQCDVDMSSVNRHVRFHHVGTINVSRTGDTPRNFSG